MALLVSMILESPAIYRWIAPQFPVRKARWQSLFLDAVKRCLLCNVSLCRTLHAAVHAVHALHAAAALQCGSLITQQLAILAPGSHLKPRLLWTLQAAHGLRSADSHAASSCHLVHLEQLITAAAVTTTAGEFKFSGRNPWLGTKTRDKNIF